MAGIHWEMMYQVRRAIFIFRFNADHLFIYYRFTPLHNTTLTYKQTNKKKTKTKKSCGEGDNQKHQCAILGMSPLINIQEKYIQIEI